MSRLLFVYENDMPTVSILRDEFTKISIDGLQSVFVCLTDISSKMVDESDIIVFVRPANVFAWKIARQAQNSGHIVITYCDDDLLNLPEHIALSPWRKKGLISTLSSSDIIMSSNRNILHKYKDSTKQKRAALLDTIVWPEEMERTPRLHDDNHIKIVYAASEGHIFLFDKYIKPIIGDLVEEYGCRLSFTFVGVHPKLEGIKHEYVPTMSLPIYRRYMRENAFDIGIAPLEDSGFFRCKYYNKFIEYTLHSIVGVYSNVEPYTFIVKDGYNGYLAKNTSLGWKEAIKKAIDDEDARNRCVDCAKESLKDYNSEKSVMEQLRKDIPELFDKSSAYKKCESFKLMKIMYYISLCLDVAYQSLYYVKREGVASVLKKGKRRITRRIKKCKSTYGQLH